MFTMDSSPGEAPYRALLVGQSIHLLVCGVSTVLPRHGVRDEGERFFISVYFGMCVAPTTRIPETWQRLMYGWLMNGWSDEAASPSCATRSNEAAPHRG